MLKSVNVYRSQIEKVLTWLYAQPYNYLSSYFRFNSYIYKYALFTPTKVANKKNTSCEDML